MKKYLLFCSLLIMVLCSCFFVHGASGEVYPGGYSGSQFYTSSDNVTLEYVDIGDDFTAWYNESLLNFPYVQDFRDITGSYYIGSDNVEMTYEISEFNDYTAVASSNAFRFMRLDFGHSFLPVDNDNATIIRLFLDALEDDPKNFTYNFYISGYDLQFINDEWIQVPFNYSNTYTHTFTSDSPLFDFNYLSMFGEDLLQYASNGILNVNYMTISINNDDSYEGSIDRHYIYYRKLNTTLTSSSDWYGNISFDISDLGVSLLQGVSNFLAFQIYPGFSLLDLLYLIVGIPLLIAILKLFLGG